MRRFIIAIFMMLAAFGTAQAQQLLQPGPPGYTFGANGACFTMTVVPCASPTPAPTPTVAPTPQPTPTPPPPTPVPTASPPPPTPAPTATPLPPTPMPTASPVPAVTPIPTPIAIATPSPSGTVVLGTNGAVTDATGNMWAINAAGLITVNGVVDNRTANVIELAYVNGLVWQENSALLWWSKTAPSAQWLPPAGTSVSPLPASPISERERFMRDRSAAVRHEHGR